MHIPQLNIDDPRPYQESRPLPMQSNAGWYVGQVYWDSTAERWFPHSRSSHYMESREDVVRMMDYTGIDLQDLANEHGFDAEDFYEAYRLLESEGMEDNEEILRLLDRLAYEADDLHHKVACYAAESGMTREPA